MCVRGEEGSAPDVGEQSSQLIPPTEGIGPQELTEAWQFALCRSYRQ